MFIILSCIEMQSVETPLVEKFTSQASYWPLPSLVYHCVLVQESAEATPELLPLPSVLVPVSVRQ